MAAPSSPIGKGAVLSKLAADGIPDALVASAPESVQIPVPDPAPTVRVEADMPPVAIRPIVMASNRPAVTSQSVPVSSATRANLVAATLGAPRPKPAVQIALSRPAAAPAAVTNAVGVTANGPYVQLAALPSQPEAIFEWRRLNKRLSSLLDGHEQTVTRAEGHGKTYWLLRMSHFANFADADELCDKLKAERQRCLSHRGF
jgi:hypothetical protein